MVKVRVCHQHQVDGRKIADLDTWFAQALQQKQPACEVRIDEDILSAHLQKKTRVPNEGQAEISVGNEFWLTRLSRAGSHRRVTHQSRELAGAFAKRRILQGHLKQLFSSHFQNKIADQNRINTQSVAPYS